MTSKTLKQFVKEQRVTINADMTDENPNMPGEYNMDHWKCVLNRRVPAVPRDHKRRMTVYFSMGYGHNGKAPTAEDVLECLFSDAAGYINAGGFEDWCDEYGYDSNSRKAERMYKTIGRQADQLKRFFGDDPAEFVFNLDY